MSLITKNILIFFSFKLLVLVAVVSCVSLTYLNEIDGILTAYEVTIAVIANPYYVTFISLPFLIFMIYKLQNDYSIYMIIRFKKIRNYIYIQFISIFIIISIYVIIQILVVIMITRAVLPHQNIFLFMNQSVDLTQTVFDSLKIYSYYNETPLIALFKLAGYMIFGMYISSILFYIVINTFSKKIVLIIQIIEYMGMIVAVHSIDQYNNIIGYLFINNYFILHFGYNYNINHMLEIMLLTIIILVIYLNTYLNKNVKVEY
ncbi:hypothetical protein GC105_11250 [Alkalibaculum sp. M08DMB]|uniref:Uncharacterized protein n=1 Tax=Alkalibaculum sporogenes TaxID=2655001 RepID=A0A6A7KA99_9FIRM|nr:hypothetical protein [Alkalibaculum sporogenes]MPW26364.1 hypothetical protein [Alkalibaculum sporogenes]